MKLSSNRKILAVGALILLVCLVISLMPWYRAYTAEDERWGCAKLRMLIESYEDESGSDGDGIPATTGERLSRAIGSFYQRSEYVVTAMDSEDNAYTVDGLCPAGGRYAVHVDEQGRFHVSCDVTGHDNDYSEYQ